jgi:hypothetical protein
VDRADTGPNPCAGVYRFAGFGDAEYVRQVGLESVGLFARICLRTVQNFTQENVMSILESDWKKFKELRKIALDRFCQGVLADVKAIAQLVRQD